MQHLHPRPPYHPPVTPSIPLQSITSLIPRLTSTIRDIDTFQNLIAQGNVDGSMPDWDKLLERYQILLSRISALYTSLSPPPTTSITSTAPTQLRSRTDLRNYLITPLNSLPVDDEKGYMQQDLFFHSLNTLPLDEISRVNGDLLSGTHADGPGTTSSSKAPWATKEELRSMSEGALAKLLDSLRDRARREADKSGALSTEIREGIGRFVWDMRIEDGEDGDDEEVKQVPGGGEITGPGRATHEDIAEDDDDDLFGDDEEQESIIIPVPAPPQPSTTAPKPVAPPNPREGWTLTDYVRFMDTGRTPS